jgi:hypothetical protein
VINDVPAGNHVWLLRERQETALVKWLEEIAPGKLPRFGLQPPLRVCR